MTMIINPGCSKKKTNKKLNEQGKKETLQVFTMRNISLEVQVGGGRWEMEMLLLLLLLVLPLLMLLLLMLLLR